MIDFNCAGFTGGTVSFTDARCAGGTLDLQDINAWRVPPSFDEAVLASPPAGLWLPSTG